MLKCCSRGCVPLAHCVLVAVVALLGMNRASGGVIVSNGDFSQAPVSGYPQGFAHNIPAWGESGESITFRDFLLSAFRNAYDDENGTAGVGDSDGYIYQEIGTSDLAQELRVSGLNYWRNDSSFQRGELRVEAFWLASGDPFTFAEFGNDILGIGTPLGEHIVNIPAAPGGTVPFDVGFDLNGLASDSRLFIRFTAGPTVNAYAYVDNVNVELVESSETVSEPTSLALLAIGACGLVAARCRRKPGAGEAPDKAVEV